MTKARNIAEFADDLSVSNGEVSIADLKPSQSMMFRNRIINGDMRIDQRNAGASVGPFASASAGYKGVDRWFIASDPMTSQQITGNTPTGFSHYLKLTKGSGSNIDIRQTVELPAAGQAGQFGVGSVWTLSFYAKSVAGGETLNFSSYFRLGVATGTFTAVSAPTPSSITLTTNWTRYSVLFTIDVSPGASDLCIAFGLNTTATELHLTGVQLEEGPVATPFEHRPIGMELSLCKRYYATGRVSGLVGYAGGIQSYFADVNFEVEMRATPTAYVSYNGTAGTIRDNNNGTALTGWTTIEGTNKYIAVRNSNNSVGAANHHFSTTYFAEAEL